MHIEKKEKEQMGRFSRCPLKFTCRRRDKELEN